MDALAAILDAARGTSHLCGVVPHLISGSVVSLLQYTYNTIIMVEGTSEDISNLKFLLLCFQEMPGMAINFAKNEVLVMGYSELKKSSANRLNCHLGSFPTAYLGLAANDGWIGMKELQHVVDKVEHRVDPWQSRLTSKASKPVLIFSSLASFPLFAMGLYLFP